MIIIHFISQCRNDTKGISEIIATLSPITAPEYQGLGDKYMSKENPCVVVGLLHSLPCTSPTLFGQLLYDASEPRYGLVYYSEGIGYSPI